MAPFRIFPEVYNIFVRPVMVRIANFYQILNIYSEYETSPNTENQICLQKSLPTKILTNIIFMSVSRSSVDSSPCSSIGRHYSSPPPARTIDPLLLTKENVYGAPPTRDQAVYGVSDPVYELPLNSLPRYSHLILD